MFPATALAGQILSNGLARCLLGMQSLSVWFPPVACCMAIQGFWLGALFTLQPRLGPSDLQDLHRFSGANAPTLNMKGLKPRV